MVDWRRFRETALRPTLANEGFTFAWVNPFSGQLEAVHKIAPGTVVLCDGTFTARSELSSLYDYRILVEADGELAVAARAHRDRNLGDDWRRYIDEVWLPDERRHLATLDPAAFEARVKR